MILGVEEVGKKPLFQFLETESLGKLREGHWQEGHAVEELESQKGDG